jgi:hypothetical protein
VPLLRPHASVGTAEVPFTPPKAELLTPASELFQQVCSHKPLLITQAMGSTFEVPLLSITLS